VQGEADQAVVDAIAQGDKIVSLTIEGDTTELLASVPQVAEWNGLLDG
jgi:peptidyl-prolyl cis-trans isomerase B (cyclophilin B)